MLYMDIKKKKASLRDNIKMPLYMYLSLPKSSLSVSDGKAEKYLKIQWTVESGKWWYFHIEIKAWNRIGRCCGELESIWIVFGPTRNRNSAKKCTSSGDRSMTSSEFQVQVWIWHWCNGDTVCAAGRAGNVVNVCGYADKAALMVYIGT